MRRRKGFAALMISALLIQLLPFKFSTFANDEIQIQDVSVETWSEIWVENSNDEAIFSIEGGGYT